MSLSIDKILSGHKRHMAVVTDLNTLYMIIVI